MSGITVGNLTLGLDKLFEKPFDYLGEKLRDFLKNKIERASTQDLWAIIPAFSYYANFIAPVAYAIAQKHQVEWDGKSRFLNPSLDKLEVRILEADEKSLGDLLKDFREVKVQATPRSFTVLASGLDSHSIKLMDFPPMLKTVRSIQMQVKFTNAATAQNVGEMQKRYAEQLCEFLANDDNSRPFVILADT